MSEKITLYHLPPSPNNMKVRIALNHKGLAFDRVDVDMKERSEVIRVSGQPMTPVLVHGDRVVFDSGAILRYLDSNFRNTARLYSEDYQTIKEIENWEFFGRNEVEKPVGMIFRQFFAEKKDPAELARASEMMHEKTGRIEDRLAHGEWLVGNSLTAADITSAPFISYSMLSPEAAKTHPIGQFFLDHLHLGEGREKTRAWVNKVMSLSA